MRPNWQIDLKWLSGLVLLMGVSIAGILFTASKLTEREPATGLFTAVMTTFAKESGGAEGFDQIQAQATAHPDRDFTIEGVTLPVKGSDLEGLTYDQAVALVVGRIAERLYTGGPDSVRTYFQDADTEEPDGGAALGPFGLLTEKNHDIVRDAFTYSLVIVALIAMPVVLFSRGFGRLGSPGFVLAVATAPFALLWLVIDQATNDAGGVGLNDSLARAISPVAGDLSSAFVKAFAVGLVMMTAAVIGNFLLAAWHQIKQSSAAERGARAARQTAAAAGYVTGAPPSAGQDYTAASTEQLPQA